MCGLIPAAVVATTRSQKYAAELVALAPEVILAIGNVTLAPLIEATRAVPIVFMVVIDPVRPRVICSGGQGR